MNIMSCRFIINKYKRKEINLISFLLNGYYVMPFNLKECYNDLYKFFKNSVSIVTLQLRKQYECKMISLEQCELVLVTFY